MDAMLKLGKYFIYCIPQPHNEVIIHKVSLKLNQKKTQKEF